MKFYINLILTSLTAYSAQAMEPAETAEGRLSLSPAEAKRIAEAIEWQSYLNKQHNKRVMNLIALDYFKNSRSRADYETSPLIMKQLYKNSLFLRKLKADRATKIASAACVIVTDPSLASSPGRKLLELESLSRAASSKDATRLIETQKAYLLPKIRRMPKLEL